MVARNIDNFRGSASASTGLQNAVDVLDALLQSHDWTDDGLIPTGGVAGDSAYTVAVKNGFVGTQAQWLTSLIGAQGNAGADGSQGIQGIQGIQGPQGDPGAGLPSGVVVMWGGLLANIPSGWNLCNGLNGTPDLRSMFIKGSAAGIDPGVTGGAATHSHSDHVVTQPSNHAALSHAGAAVAAHVFTQAIGHAAHVFTQAAAHVFTQPGGHSAHVVGQPSDHSALTNNHAGAAVGTSGAGSSHTHTGPSHTHTDASTTATPKLVTGNTSTGVAGVTGAGGTGATGGEAAHTHAAGAVTQPSAHGAISSHTGATVDAHSAHSGGAVDAHSGSGVDAHDAHSGAGVDAHGVTQANDHAAQSHVGTAVDAHSTVNSEPAYFSLAFIQKA